TLGLPDDPFWWSPASVPSDAVAIEYEGEVYDDTDFSFGVGEATGLALLGASTFGSSTYDDTNTAGGGNLSTGFTSDLELWVGSTPTLLPQIAGTPESAGPGGNFETRTLDIDIDLTPYLGDDWAGSLRANTTTLVPPVDGPQPYTSGNI